MINTQRFALKRAVDDRQRKLLRLIRLCQSMKDPQKEEQTKVELLCLQEAWRNVK